MMRPLPPERLSYANSENQAALVNSKQCMDDVNMKTLSRTAKVKIAEEMKALPDAIRDISIAVSDNVIDARSRFEDYYDRDPVA